MPSHEQALASILSQLALSFDGAVLGVALAYAAVRSFLKYTTSSRALTKIRSAPTLKVSDLRSLIADEGNPSDLVIVTGQVEPKSVVDGGNRKSLRPSVLVAHESGDQAAIVQRTQTCIYNEWKGFLGWTSDFRTILGRSWREQESSSTRLVPFVLIDDSCKHQNPPFVSVNMDGATQPLPLVTVYHHLQPLDASPYTFLQALFGHEYPVGLLDEEKILPLGKTITAVGVFRFNNGSPELLSSSDLPYYLTDLSKEQMVSDLSSKARILMWSGVVLGSLSIGVLGYAVFKNWNRLKRWRSSRRSDERLRSDPTAEVDANVVDDEAGEVPEGQLCVICLLRRRRSAFIPCGHLACCQICASSVEREISPKCPLCRQSIHTTVRIFS